MEYPDCSHAILDRVFDNYFEIDFKARTLRNIKSESNILSFTVGSIRMMLDDALEAWINNEVHEDDRQNLWNLFKTAEAKAEDNGKTCVRFRIDNAYGSNWYSGRIIKFCDEQCWFGFNSVSERESVELQPKRFEEKQRYIEWSAKLAVVFSRAGVTVADYDYENKKFWVAKGIEQYRFAKKQIGYMSNKEAIEYIHPDDTELWIRFLNRIKSKKYEFTESILRILMADGKYLWNYIGVNLFYDENRNIVRIMITLRVIDDEKKKEMFFEYLKKHLNKLLNNTEHKFFSFRIEENKIRIIYFTDKCSRYFGVTLSELNFRLAGGEPVDKILKSMVLTDEQYRTLIKEENCVFEITDVDGKTEFVEFRCKKIDETYFVTLYPPEDKSRGRYLYPKNRRHDIRINTFGFFDMFVDGQPVLFGSEKVKELMALLVDRRGGYISTREAIGYLWDDVYVDERIIAKYRKLTLKLKNTLKKYDVDYILENINGKRRIVVSEVDCDLYNYLSGDRRYMNSFHGVYMTNYSWGEITLAGL